MDMKVQKSRKYIAKKLGVLAMAAVITGGSFCQPVFAAKTGYLAQSRNYYVGGFEGELYDKSGKQCGEWKIDANNVLSMTGTGVPVVNGTPEWNRTGQQQVHIERVEIAETLRPESIDGWFSGCGFLKEVGDLPDSIKSAEHAFFKCSELKKVGKLPEHLVSACYMFGMCSNLEKLPELPGSITDASLMFESCTRVETDASFELPENLEQADYMFERCYKLSYVPKKLPPKLKSIEKMFDFSGITDAPELPDCIENGTAAFYHCTELKSIKNLPKNLKKADKMFDYCPNLRKLPRDIEIPSTAPDGMFTSGSSSIGISLPYGNESLKNYDWNKAYYNNVTYYCNVKFEDAKGNILSSIDLDFGGALTADQIPKTQKGYCWDSEDFKKNISTNLIVKEIKKEYTVKFQDWNGKLLNEQKVGFEEAAKEPKAPARTGYTFTGWDKSFDKITGDTVVKAEYNKNEYTVKFQDWNGKLLNEQKVGFEEAAKEPKAPVRTGYTFTGWDKSFDKITGEITVTAKYSRNPAKADPTPHYTVQSKKPGVESLNRKLPLTKAVKSGRQIKVRWKKKKGAKGYIIYYSTKKKGKYKKIAVVGKRSNTKVILKSGKKYYFKARPYVQTKKGKIKYKKFIKAKKKELNKVVQATYRNVTGHIRYEVWMKEGKKKYKKVKTFYHGGTLIYTKQKAKTGKKYKFLLKASDIKNGSNARVIK